MFGIYIDQLLSELSTRFSVHFERCAKLQYILPAYCNDTNFNQLQDIVQMYAQDIESEGIVRGEFDMWCARWKNAVGNVPSTPTDTLASVPGLADLYPNIHTLITIFAVIPATSATAERTFSTLRRLKSYLRSTMSNQRLTGLALMAIDVDIDDVINRMALKRRRLDFSL